MAAFVGGAGLYLAAKIMQFHHFEMDSLGTSLVTFRIKTLSDSGTDL
jgi:hypothetical protein